MVENTTDAIETFEEIDSVTATRTSRADLLVGVYDDDDVGKFFGKQRRENVERVDTGRDEANGVLYSWLTIE